MTPSQVATNGLNVAALREDFPLLRRTVHGRPVVYLDSAATALKPQCVLDELARFYTEFTANVHRAVHALSEEATQAFEDARSTVARFIGADDREILFVRNATEAINVVAHSLPSDATVAAPLSEHHSNLLPWRSRAWLGLPVRADGVVDAAAAAQLIREHRPALVALSAVHNVLGVRTPRDELIAGAREVGALVLLDASQLVGHEPFSVSEVDADFVCFSGHKMLGPTGVGVLYRRETTPLALQPMLLGGAMVKSVQIDDFSVQDYPWGLEAGTPHVEGVLGLAAACDYLDTVGLESIHAHGRQLCAQAREGLGRIARVRLLGDPALDAGSIVTFVLDGLPAHGVARQLSDRFAIMARSGHHCAQPLHELCGLPETVRMSVHLYNTEAEVAAFVEAIGIIAQTAAAR